MKVQFSLWMTQSLNHKFLLTMTIYLLATFIVYLLLLIPIYEDQKKTSVALSLLISLPTGNDRWGAPLPASKAPAALPNFVTPSSTAELETLRTASHPQVSASCANCHHLLTQASLSQFDHPTTAMTAGNQTFSRVLLHLGIGLFLTLFSWIVMGWFLRRFVQTPLSNLLHISKSSGSDLGLPLNESSEDELRGDEMAKLGQLLTGLSTRLRNTIAEAREQKIFFQAMLNAIPDGIRVIDKNYMVIATNQSYHQQLGLPPLTMGALRSGISCYASSHGRKHPCPPTLVTCPLHEIKKTGRPLKTITEHLRTDGTKLQVEICAAPLQIVTEGQMETFVVESVRDLTQAIQFSHEQKLASLGQLAAGVAHDIHNPLSSIRLALQSAVRSLEASTPNVTRVHHYLNIVDKQIDKCITVTQRLLKLSATGSEQPQLVCLKEVVTDTIALLEYDAKERGVEIQTQFNNLHDCRVLASETDMRMLLLNLLQNALNAMPQGGHIHVQLRNKLGKVMLCIQDTGVGIPPHILNNIFEPFFSYRPNSKKGSGLGLAICKSIVERHHGRIEVSNTDQRGSQFVVSLPEAQTQCISHSLAKAV